MSPPTGPPLPQSLPQPHGWHSRQAGGQGPAPAPQGPEGALAEARVAATAREPGSVPCSHGTCTPRSAVTTAAASASRIPWIPERSALGVCGPRSTHRAECAGSAGPLGSSPARVRLRTCWRVCGAARLPRGSPSTGAPRRWAAASGRASHRPAAPRSRTRGRRAGPGPVAAGRAPCLLVSLLPLLLGLGFGFHQGSLRRAQSHGGDTDSFSERRSARSHAGRVGRKYCCGVFGKSHFPPPQIGVCRPRCPQHTRPPHRRNRHGRNCDLQVSVLPRCHPSHTTTEGVRSFSQAGGLNCPNPL